MLFKRKRGKLIQNSRPQMSFCLHARLIHQQKQIVNALAFFPCLLALHFQTLKSGLCLCYACHSESDYMPSHFPRVILLLSSKPGKMYVFFFSSRDVYRALIFAGYSETWKWDYNWVMVQLHQGKVQILAHRQ